MKRLSLRAKMLLCILPVMAIAMILLTYVAATSSRQTIREAMSGQIEQTVQANVNEVSGNLDVIKCTAVNITEMVSSSYKFASMDSFKRTLTSIIKENDSVLGAGLWFEPNAFDTAKKYMGPYWYKDGSEIVETYDYSNSDYDYFTQEYYLNAKSLPKSEAQITDPYYDPTTNLIMATCSAPIYDGDTFIGCVTVDMELSNIQNMVSNMKVGKTGVAILTASDGTYLYTQDTDAVANAVNITADSNSSLAAAGSKMMSESNTEAHEAYFTENGHEYMLCYNTIPGVNWKMAFRMSVDELDASVNSLITQLFIICIAALLIGAVIIWLFVFSISRSINRVKEFAGILAKGDFTVDKIRNRRGDELGQMSESLNNMFENNRDVISKISNGSVQVSETSTGLATMASELSGQFSSIQSNISGVNDAMMSSGAATQQVNASVEEVNASVHQLAAETEKTSTEAADIKNRARDIERQSRHAYDNAISIAEQREQDLIEANEKAKIVDQIGTLADTISEIADQINLLSLNASIEAARAGDAGKGFAVVASEINKLASSTSEAVEKIRDTVDGVQEAFGTLSGSSGELLQFIRETVTPDYDNFINVAKQYGDDAGAFGDSSESIAQMVENIRVSMEEVSKAVQNIAESTQDTADLSSKVNDSVMAAADVVSSVNDMSNKQEAIAGTLGEIVGKFKLRNEE
ncbi:MAG: methyl-accepting chemotaxis protein [Butyrivibrio sp.]|nr:methyl-accepting chemotaxis protein [Butyrivibrio sp.]